MNWKVYLLKCADGSLYCGITKDVSARVAVHNAGKGARCTRVRRPVELVAVSGGLSRSEALKLEYRVKKTPTGRKRGAVTTGPREATNGNRRQKERSHRDD